MMLGEFLKKYRDSVKAATGNGLSVRALSEMLSVSQHRLTKWEIDGAMPFSNSDRLSLKLFFGIEDLENISPDVLKKAVERYPKPFAAFDGDAKEIPLVPKDSAKKIDAPPPDENQLLTGGDKIGSQPTKNQQTMPDAYVAIIQSMTNIIADQQRTISELATKLPSGVPALNYKKQPKKHPQD